MQALVWLSLGFGLGLSHASDADHIAAMSTVVSQRRDVASATRAGAAWGLGHATTVFVVGGAFVLSRHAVPDQVSLALELVVALMLVVLGVRALVALGRPAVHPPVRTLRQSVAIGFVHGLAGSAAAAVAVLAHADSVSIGLLYLGMFGLGTVAGMLLLTTAFAAPLVWARGKLDRIVSPVRAVAALASVGVGIALGWQVGFVDGLFG